MKYIWKLIKLALLLALCVGIGFAVRYWDKIVDYFNPPQIEENEKPIPEEDEIVGNIDEIIEQIIEA